MDSLQKITERIKARREELDLSYQDLADLTGLSKSTLQRYETGEIRSLPISKVPILAKALQMTPLELTGWEPLTFSASEIDLICKYRALDDRGRSAVLSILEHEYDSAVGKAEVDSIFSAEA